MYAQGGSTEGGLGERVFSRPLSCWQAFSKAQSPWEKRKSKIIAKKESAAKHFQQADKYKSEAVKHDGADRTKLLSKAEKEEESAKADLGKMKIKISEMIQYTDVYKKEVGNL